jgi:toxin ParE1/3/4
VSEYRLTRLAVSDLKSISEYSVRRWGLEQNERYLEELQKILNLLAANPALGRACYNIREGYRRMEHGRHVVFYRVPASGEGIEVIRVLHERMLPKEQFSKP